MNRSNLRSLPTLVTSPAPRVAVDAARAESELAGLFDGLLARGREDEESPGYELLEAAVDGTLDPVEAELFSSRLAGDPVLQREFDDLVALRNQLALANTATSAAASRRPAASRWLGFAAAAVLLAALGLGLRQEHRPTTAGLAGAPEAATGTSQVVFVDSFEGGTTHHWSN